MRLKPARIKQIIREELLGEAEIPDALLGQLMGSMEDLDPESAGLGNLISQTLEKNPDALSGEDAGAAIKKIVGDNPDALKDILGSSGDMLDTITDFFKDNPESIPEEITAELKDGAEGAMEEYLKAEGYMKITKKQLQRIIKEEKHRLLREQQAEVEMQPGGANGHHWPRVEWSNVGELVDKWFDAELKAFDKGDPTMMAMGDNAKEAKEVWKAQIDDAAIDLENELTRRIRQMAYKTMEEFTSKLMNGDYA